MQFVVAVLNVQTMTKGLNLLDKFYLAAVCAAVPGLGRTKVLRLVKILGSAQAVFESDFQTLFATGVCNQESITNFLKTRKSYLPQKLEFFCSREGVELITIFDEGYPQSLRQISDPPLVLYVHGKLPVSDYNIAVVGSREASHYGVKAAAVFASALARENIHIISGGARGIDTAAHEACLAAGGKTVAVLGCGLDIVYPAANRKLFKRIAENGAVVSEYPPGTPPRSQHFPARNRIIVGLSRGVLVAEAARKSGALITANIAADEGREVYCVPGNIFEGSSIGCHDLIRTGAKLVDSPQDILEDRLNWQFAMSRMPVEQDMFAALEQTVTKVKLSPVSELGQQILATLSQGALSLEEITEQSGEELSVISMELLDLQLNGYVEIDRAQKYYRL